MAAMAGKVVAEVAVKADSFRVWLCGWSNWLGCNELFKLAAEWLVPERDEDSLSAKKPRRLEELNTSWAEVRTLLLRSSLVGVGEERKRVVAGVWRGVASLDERRGRSAESSGEDDLLRLDWIGLWSCDLRGAGR